MEDEAAIRLAKLETKFDERWDAHDRRSEENWDGIRSALSEIKAQLAGLSAKFSDLPCGEHDVRNRSMAQNIRWVWGILITFIGGIVLAFVGHLFGGKM